MKPTAPTHEPGLDAPIPVVVRPLVRCGKDNGKASAPCNPTSLFTKII